MSTIDEEDPNKLLPQRASDADIRPSNPVYKFLDPSSADEAKKMVQLQLEVLAKEQSLQLERRKQEQQLEFDRRKFDQELQKQLKDNRFKNSRNWMLFIVGLLIFSLGAFSLVTPYKDAAVAIMGAGTSLMGINAIQNYRRNDSK